MCNESCGRKHRDTNSRKAVGQGRNGMEVPAEVRELSRSPKAAEWRGKVVKPLKMKTKICA